MPLGGAPEAAGWVTGFTRPPFSTFLRRSVDVSVREGSSSESPVPFVGEGHLQGARESVLLSGVRSESVWPEGA